MAILGLTKTIGRIGKRAIKNADDLIKNRAKRTAPKVGNSVSKSEVPTARQNVKGSSSTPKTDKPFFSRGAKKAIAGTGVVAVSTAVVGSAGGFGISQLGDGVSDFIKGVSTDPNISNRSKELDNSERYLEQVREAIELFSTGTGGMGADYVEKAGTTEETGSSNPAIAGIGIGLVALAGYFGYKAYKKKKK